MNMKRMCGGTETKGPESKTEPMADVKCGCGCGPWMMGQQAQKKEEPKSPPPPMP